MKKDKELYQEFLNGNMDALDELIEIYISELIYFIYKYINDYYAAQDLAQEVFVYLLQHKETYKFEYSFRAYLYKIANSRSLNYIKARKKIVFIEDTSDESIGKIADIESEVIRNVDNENLRNAVKKLKKEYQLVIYLVDFKELSYEETAIIMNKSIAQIKTLIYNARKRLKQILT